MTVPVHMMAMGIDAMAIPIPARSLTAMMRIAVKIAAIVMGRITRPFAAAVAVAVIAMVPITRFRDGRLNAGDDAEGEESKE